jgi:Fur family ferric uptake transcriptional regulator
LICVECEKIVEFEDDDIEILQRKVAQKYRFKLVRHKLELYGLCPECQAKKA